jgi:hypothetical protein
MTPDREPDVGPVDVQDDSDRHDLEHAMDAHEARDDLPASSATLRSSLFRSYRSEVTSYQQRDLKTRRGKWDLPTPMVINNSVINETKHGNKDS